MTMMLLAGLPLIVGGAVALAGGEESSETEASAQSAACCRYSAAFFVGHIDHPALKPDLVSPGQQTR
jgi:hypothetical protein